jgi:hypothetical protein
MGGADEGSDRMTDDFYFGLRSPLLAPKLLPITVGWDFLQTNFETLVITRRVLIGES